MVLGARLRRLTALLLAVSVLLAALPTALSVHAQGPLKVAYVYDTDTAARDNFKAFLELRGFAVQAVSLAAAAETDFTAFDVVVLGNDTGSSSSPYVWKGGAVTIRRLLTAERYVVTVGYAAQFFDAHGGLNLGWGPSWVSSGDSVLAVSPGAPFWGAPDPVPLAAAGTAKLYNRPTTAIAVYNPEPNTLVRIGREVADTTHYAVAAQAFVGQRGPICKLQWGFALPPARMTVAGQNLFTNLLRANPCAAGQGASADLRISKGASAQSVPAGQPITYTLTATNAGKDPAPAVRIEDALPAGFTLVSATASQGSCGLSGATLVCAVGTLAPGATVTVTVVAKASEAGEFSNTAVIKAPVSDPNLGNNQSSVTTVVGQPAGFKPLVVAPYRPVLIGPIAQLPQSDLSIFGVEVTQGIQCFDTSQGLSGCADNSLPLVARKPTTARIYVRYSGPGTSMNNVPVRLVLIDANNVEYVANTTGRALASIDRANAGSSANVFFTVNFNATTAVRYYAIVDPGNTVGETNEGNNRFPPSGTASLTYTPSKTMKIVGQRLRYRPSGYTGTQYAGGWAVNGGAAQWLEHLLPIRGGGIGYSVKSGYLDWQTSLGDGDGQHDLIRSLNARWIMENAFSWLFGTGAYTGARHVYGWAPNDGYSGGHADMPIYPHAGGLSVVGIGTDRPGTSTDNPGGGALIFGHELVHNYNLKHTDTADACGSSDDSSTFPYSSSSIQEFGFNPATSKVYDPSNTHDLMSYCPAGGSREGWISPFTWSAMFNQLRAGGPSAVSELAATADEVLAINLSVANPALGPAGARFDEVARSDAATPLVLPAPGDYAVELRDAGGAALRRHPFPVSFKSEYSAHDDPPGDPADLAEASAHMIVPWEQGTVALAVVHNGQTLATRALSATAPAVEITSPAAPESWAAGTTGTISWQALDPDGDTLRYSVLYSRDGESWELLASDLATTSYSVASDDLAGSSEGRFRVVANDGANIAFAETPPISIPNKLPQAVILNPGGPGAAVLPGDLLVLQGLGQDFEDGALPDLTLEWASDRDGALGTGAELPMVNLSPGTHRITLRATDSAGQSATASVEVFVGNRVMLPMVRQ